MVSRLPVKTKHHKNHVNISIGTVVLQYLWILFHSKAKPNKTIFAWLGINLSEMILKLILLFVTQLLLLQTPSVVIINILQLDNIVLYFFVIDKNEFLAFKTLNFTFWNFKMCFIEFKYYYSMDNEQTSLILNWQTNLWNRVYQCNLTMH